MVRYRLAVGFLVLGIVIAAAAGRSPRRVSSPHSPAWRVPTVSSISFSPDGKWVAASYFRYAINRPGTDWRAFVAEWEVEGKTRTIVPDAYAPIAFRPDSKALAMGIYKRFRKLGYMNPHVRLAIWDVGKPSLRRILSDQDESPGPAVAAAVWSTDGKRIAAVTEPAGLLVWDSDYKSLPVHIPAKSPLGDAKVRRDLKPTGAAFSADGKSLLTTFAIGKCWHRAVLWRKGEGGLAPVETYSEGLITRDASVVSLLGRLPKDGWLYTVAGKGKLVVTVNERRRRLIALWDHVRISPDGNLIAIGARGKTVLRTGDGKFVKTFPAGGGPLAFSSDSKRIAASDNRGIIRAWDIESSKLVRTMRLDDRHKENTVLAAAIQCASKFGDPKGNRKRIASLVVRAARRGAKIVVLPETAVTGYMSSDIKTAWQVPGREISDDLKGVDPKDAAETVPGASTKFFASLADQYGIYLTVPLLEVDRKTKKYYNTSVLLGPDGRILIHYRKRNPWLWAEKGWAEEGNLGNPVVDTPFGRLGLLICFDVHEQFKVMSKLKIDTLLYSIAWVDDHGSDWFSRQLPARTKECGFNLIGANWTVPKNPEPTWHGYGKSLIVSSRGKILAKAVNDLAEETLFAEIPIPTK